ncbi:MAG TPA: nucleotidyltransferase family protein [Bryobacteraceae bacterium]|nr:nucleotidyltransferase family protein [Bryobacteraceae bacterium]
MGVSPARALLFAGARLNAESRALDELAQRDVDWADVLKGANWHGITPLLARNLKSVTSVPDSVRQKLIRFERVNAFRSLHMATRIRLCLKALHDHGLDAIPWKGPALAFEAYGDLTRRTSCDIDFLVKPGELAAARNILLQAGFTFEPDNAALTSQRLLRMEKISGEVRLLGPDRSFLVELHAQFLHPTMADSRVLHDMWDRSYCGTAWDGQPIRKLCVPDLLLTLCVHATKHGWDRLKWVIDIAAVLQQQSTPIDWSDLMNTADAYGVSGMLLLGLALAHRNAGASLPGEVLARIDAHATLRKIVEEQDQVYVTDTLPTLQLTHALKMRTAMEPLWRRAAVALREAVGVTSVDVAEFPASDRWLWLVPLYRPWRLVQRVSRP